MLNLEGCPLDFLLFRKGGLLNNINVSICRQATAINIYHEMDLKLGFKSCSPKTVLTFPGVNTTHKNSVGGGRPKYT